MRKEDAFAALGGKCTKCGTGSHLELDHIDPSTKLTHRIWSFAKQRRDEELAKCQLLCKTCHSQKSLQQPPTSQSIQELLEKLTH